jgi:hypothetical protein
MSPQRKRLHLARASDAPKSPSLALVKKALRMYAGKGISRETRHRNARAWIAARLRMGDQHVLNKSFAPRWGVAGDGRGVSQVFAPRRLGA